MEKYEIELPVMSAHNLVIGTAYVDIGETMRVLNLTTKDYAEIRFTRRSWFSKEEFKLEGEVYKATEASKADIMGKPTKNLEQLIDKKKMEKVYQICGNWNDKIYLQKVLPKPDNVKDKSGQPTLGEKECVWTKAVYPDKWDHMYGMSHFSLQLNYFPVRLHNVVAPTDTRRRPD